MAIDKKQSLVALHSAVLLFALSGLFGKWLDLPATYIVFGRAFFAAITLGVVIWFAGKQSLTCSKEMLIRLAFSGAILAFHWASFFQSIQMSSVAIGLITFATFPVFVSFIEPVFFGEKFHAQSVVQALLTVVGIYLILPDDTLDVDAISGVYWGVSSALSFALLTVINRKFVVNQPAKKVALYQNGFAALFILPLVVYDNIVVTVEQISVLILLGVVFTAFAHSLFNYSLKKLKAQIASLAVSLEPIYGIVAAYFLLGESINLVMAIGAAIVLMTNVWATKSQ